MIICGDCLEVMRGMDANSIDAIVTDPPYGLKFMGKDWDHGIPGKPFWSEALRVAKPGAHLLAFGGTRTFHRLACAIEDAGWEIRDCLGWLYGSGFPKSLDVSKAIDKAAGAKRESRIVPTRSGNAERRGQGEQGATYGDCHGGFRDESSSATDAARQWEGWGTALKPAWEPIILARKPLDGTVAANVLKWGTGAVNVDGCRVPMAGKKGYWPGDDYGDHPGVSTAFHRGKGDENIKGRWPANIIHDGSEEVLALFPETMAGHRPATRNKGFWEDKPPQNLEHELLPGGSAARFFYCAKASRREREMGCEGMEEKHVTCRPLSDDEDDRTIQERLHGRKARNHHPTVKPLALMRYLCRLVTPPNGLVLDPFCGSGSTGVAAKQEGFRFIGIDNNAEYVEIARRRMEAAR